MLAELWWTRAKRLDETKGSFNRSWRRLRRRKNPTHWKQSRIVTRDIFQNPFYPLVVVSLPRIPPSRWRQTAQSSKSSIRVCSCSLQCRLLPQASRRSPAAAASSLRRPSPPSASGWCCSCCDPHWSVDGFRSSTILNIDPRTC